MKKVLFFIKIPKIKMRTPKVRFQGGGSFLESTRRNYHPIDSKIFLGGLEDVLKRFRGGVFCFRSSKNFFRDRKVEKL